MVVPGFCAMTTIVDLLVDVGGSREVRRVATDVPLALWLVHPDIIDVHMHRERKVVEIDCTKVR